MLRASIEGLLLHLADNERRYPLTISRHYFRAQQLTYAKESNMQVRYSNSHREDLVRLEP